MKQLCLQASHDRWTYNRLLEMLKGEYAEQGRVNCIKGHVSKRHTGMREVTQFLQQTASRISREKLYGSGLHYAQYVETERLKAAGDTPEVEFGEPHFKRYSDPISIPLTITHNNMEARRVFWTTGQSAYQRWTTSTCPGRSPYSTTARRKPPYTKPPT